MLIAMLKNIGTDWLKIQKIMNKDASKIKLRYQKKLKEVALKKTNEDNIKWFQYKYHMMINNEYFTNKIDRQYNIWPAKLSHFTLMHN